MGDQITNKSRKLLCLTVLFCLVNLLGVESKNHVLNPRDKGMKFLKEQQKIYDHKKETGENILVNGTTHHKPAGKKPVKPIKNHRRPQNPKKQQPRRYHPIVMQDDNPGAGPDSQFDSDAVEGYNLQNPKTFDEFFYLIEAFNLGFRTNNFFPAATDCAYVLRIFLNDANATVLNATSEAFLEDTYDFLRNYTRLTSNQFATAYLYCHMTGVDVYDYVEVQRVLYGTPVDYLQAALQTMVGNIIRINNLYQKIVIATENQDMRQVWYVFGRILYYLVDIEPLDEGILNAPADGKLWKLLHTFNKLMEQQGKIMSGEIQLQDQHESYARDKIELERRMKLEEARHNPQKMTPSMDYMFKKYGETKKAFGGHPIVRQDNEADAAPDAAPSNQSEFIQYLNQTLQYIEFGSFFILELQEATIGQISGNLSICQNNSLTIYNNSKDVYYQYEAGEFDEAGNSTYRILYSVDGIFNSCYYMFFEYFIALSVYADTALDYNKVLFNLMHNLGNLYDLGEESYVRIADWENQGMTDQFWGRMGFITGTIFQDIFEQPVNYEEITNPDQYRAEREERE